MSEFEMTGRPSELSRAERALLSRMEKQIRSAESKHYWALGKALRVIREERLYRSVAGSFEEYTRLRWDIPRQTANRYIRAVEVGKDLLDAGFRRPVSEKQCRPLGRLELPRLLEVARRVKAQSGWGVVSASRVALMAEEIEPRGTTDATVARSASEGLVLVTRGGRVGPSRVAKSRILRGMEAMAAEADAIQALGPYAVEDALRAMTEAESNGARDAFARVGRLLERYYEAWRDERGDQPEDDQQRLPLAA